MLTSRITPYEASDDPEDIFSSALTAIFPDDTINSHGTPGSYVTYKSTSFGDIRLQIPQYPDEEQGRKLFAHHLWNAGVVIADAVEIAAQQMHGGDEGDGSRQMQMNTLWDRTWWDVRGKSVLELGAGTALPSIISALLGASSVAITDHPSSPALTTSTIERNVEANLTIRKNTESPKHSDIVTSSALPPISIHGHVWGTKTFYSPQSYGKPTISPTSFDKIIIADCLWMPSQHINLIKTILHFLPPKSPSSPHHPDQQLSQTHAPADSTPSPILPNSRPCALVVAGFHTGRSIVANFFSLATSTSSSAITQQLADPPWNPISTSFSTQPPAEAEAGISEEELQHTGKLELASIFEVDVDLNTRPWQAKRVGESKWEAKRWCVAAVLVRR